MNTVKNRSSLRHQLALGGLVALVLFCGVSFCLMIFSWGLRSSTPPTPKSIFVTVTPSSTVSFAALPTGMLCAAPPVGWQLYTIQPDDTLSELAARFQVNQGRIMQANCLTSTDLRAGQQLYLPPLATPTPCSSAPPEGWELYTVRSNDTLFSLATVRGTTTAEVMRVNCLSADTIAIGQSLYLPALPTPTPTNIPTPTETPPMTPTPTNTSVLLTDTPTTTPTDTPLPIEAPTVPPTPTSASVPPADTPTTAPTDTPLPPFTPTPIPVSIIAGGAWASQSSAARNWSKPCDRFQGKILIPDSSRDVELGERIYFFACNITNPIAATITQSNGLTQSVESLEPTADTLPPKSYFDLDDKVKAVIAWSALPTLTVTGRYTLTVSDRHTGQLIAKRPFFVLPPTQTHILVEPQAGPLGANFMVYYVNFTPSLTLTFDLYSQGDSSLGEDEGKLYFRTPIQMPITRTLSISSNGGWGQMPPPREVLTSPGAYAIGYKEETPEKIRQPDWSFWLR